MEKRDVYNWGKSIISHPQVVIDVHTVDDIINVLSDKEQYPSPVRAVGSNHSTTRCGVADDGTLMNMSKMDKILHIGKDTVTAQAGALYIDIVNALEAQGLQFYVNVELGNLSIGSAACGGTKDASMPGEFGQVCSYANIIKMVTPSGECLTIDEGEPELLQIVRSSYGLLGVVYEVTFKVQIMRPMAIYHEVYTLNKFIKQLPQLQARDESMMLYLYPFLNRVTVEYRHYTDGTRYSKNFIWKIRNWMWKTFAPSFAYIVTKYLPWKRLRYKLIDCLNRFIQIIQGYFLKGEGTHPSAQMIRYPDHSGISKYTFSIWAFSEECYPEVLSGYFAFCQRYYREHGYRCNMLNVGYRIFGDTSSLFSYSFDGNVMTLDPVSTGDHGWEDFLKAFNAYCSENKGIPLFNQTRSIEPKQAKKAFGQRLTLFQNYLQQYDPNERLMNLYFKERLLEK